MDKTPFTLFAAVNLLLRHCQCERRRGHSIDDVSFLLSFLNDIVRLEFLDIVRRSEQHFVLFLAVINNLNRSDFLSKFLPKEAAALNMDHYVP